MFDDESLNLVRELMVRVLRVGELCLSPDSAKYRAFRKEILDLFNETERRIRRGENQGKGQARIK